MGSVLEKNSSAVRKRIEGHSFDDEDGEEYGASNFNGFGDYFRRKKIKLQNLDADIRASSDKPQIFKGIVAHVTGYTQPPLHVLHRDIVEHGGGFLQYLDSKTMATHIIASSLPPKKSVDFNRYRIVKPNWIVDSVRAGKLLPWMDYRVLDEGPRQKVLKFGGDKGLEQASPAVRQGYREQTDNSFYTSQFRATASLPSQDMSQVAEKLQTPGRHIGTSSSIAQRSPLATTGAETRQPNSLLASKSANLEIDGPKTAITPDYRHQDTAESVPMAGRKTTEPGKDMTPEEHNAWLLSDPRLRKSSTANPDFLKQFYSESRLHHLSTWKAELKSSMQQLAAAKGLAQKKTRRLSGSRAYIMHVDFDSFFCAVSLKKHPEFVDQPTVVAHSNGSGSEIASCNYPARKFGIKNGMWMKRATELCPDIKVLPYDFPAYEQASHLFYEAIMEIGGVVQSVSIDEALVDTTDIVLSATGSRGLGVDEGNIWREQDKIEEIALSLRNKIKEMTGCAVSVGIGGNILQAKVALRRAKPAGQFHLKPDDVLNVIGELKVENLPGVSYSIGGKLEELGVKLVKDIRDVSKERLTSALGPKTSEKLRDYSRGIDQTEVGEQPPRKSVSAEVNWGIRFLNQPEAEEFVYNLCKELEKRLVNEQVRGKHLTMKIMRRCLDAPLDPAKHLGHGKCDVFNKSSSFGVATHDYETVGKEAVAILRSFKFSPGDLRGLGVQMTKLEPIKAGATAIGSSQRKLAFSSVVGPSPSKAHSKIDPIDELESPVKNLDTPSRGIEADPIADDPITPRKPKVHPAMALASANQSDKKANTPLNVAGTQFIIPTQVDPVVLAELPRDIRSRLMAQGDRTSESEVPSRPHSPVPIPSQVDPDVFNALPDDMKAEVLASYGRQPGQTVLAQSPRKDRIIPAKKSTTPTKRGAIRSLFGKTQRQRDSQAGVIQTNFNFPKQGNEAPAAETEIEELDPEFLAELPEDVRKEVVADHKRRRLAQRSALDAPLRLHETPDVEEPLAGGQRRIHFPAPPPKVSFAGFGVTSAQEIKEMLDAWHSETRDEGPHRGDVEVFERYLARVVLEERNMQKATNLVKWLDIMIEQDGEDGRGRQIWRESVGDVKKAVQDAVRERGLPPITF